MGQISFTMENLPFLLDYVKSACPKLRPVTLPAGVGEKQILKTLAEKKKLPAESDTCEICGSVEGEMTPQVMCKVDLQKRSCIVTGAKVGAAVDSEE